MKAQLSNCENCFWLIEYISVGYIHSTFVF